VDITSNLTSIGYQAFHNCSNLTSITIPSSVTVIEDSAFNDCTSLKSVIYLGSNDPIEASAGNVFNGCNQLQFVCVPSNYNSISFCGLTQFCSHESCESFLHNACYENPVCDINNLISMKKRDNATVWESKSTECLRFECDNENGPVYWNQCNESDEVCENDVCVAKNEGEESPSVIIELIDELDLTDMNMTEIRDTIVHLTEIETDEIRIRVNTNENNKITQIIVIVEDERTANKIRDAVNLCSDARSEDSKTK